MIGTRTARAALFGLVGLLAGLALPAVAAARAPSAADGLAVARPSLDLRTGDQAGTAGVALRSGEVESRGGHIPVVGFVPATPRDRAATSTPIAVVGVAALVAVSVSRAPARAPPRCSLPS